MTRIRRNVLGMALLWGFLATSAADTGAALADCTASNFSAAFRVSVLSHPLNTVLIGVPVFLIASFARSRQERQWTIYAALAVLLMAALAIGYVGERPYNCYV